MALALQSAGKLSTLMACHVVSDALLLRQHLKGPEPIADVPSSLNLLVHSVTPMDFHAPHFKKAI